MRPITMSRELRVIWPKSDNTEWAVLKQYECEPRFDRFFLKFGILILDSTINVGAKYQ